MRQSLAIAAGVLVASVFTHGIVYSGTHLGKLSPVASYDGLFQRAVLALWSAWCGVHGWAAHSHAGEFGRLLAPAVFFILPLTGFGVFALASGLRVGWQWWKPLVLAIAFATPLQDFLHSAFRAAGFSEPMAEAARAAVVMLLMVVSVSSWRIRREPAPPPQTATA